MIKILKHPNGRNFAFDSHGQPRITFSYARDGKYTIYSLYGDGQTHDQPGEPLGRRFIPKKGAQRVHDKDGHPLRRYDAPAVQALIKALHGTEPQNNPLYANDSPFKNISDRDKDDLMHFLHNMNEALGGKRLPHDPRSFAPVILDPPRIGRALR